MDNYRDYFTREELVRTLSQAAYTPGQLGRDGLFETVPLGGTQLAIEVETKDAGRVLTAIPRGSPRQIENLDKRSVKTFSTESFGDEGAVYADEVLNARALGPSGMRALIEDRRAKLVAKLRRTVDKTHEKLRMNCLTSPGTTEFGSAASTATILLGTDATKTRQEILNKLILPIEAALDGLAFSAIKVYCSDGFWATLIENKAIKDTYYNWMAAAELRGGLLQPMAFGDVLWERYRGTSDCKVPDNTAICVPVGVPETFFQGFAPNDTVDSVGAGALGQPYYMGSKEIKDSQGVKGWEVSIQTHPKMICGRPAAVIPVALT